MTPTLELAAKGIGLSTCIAFVAAMRLYFRPRSKERGANRKWVAIALSVVLVHLLLFVAATPRSVLSLCTSITLFAVANAIFWTAIKAHGDHHPSCAFGETAPPRLIISGPYAFVRHPFYLAYVTAFVGSSLVTDHWASYLTTAVVFISYNVAATREERLLTACGSMHGGSYLDYMARTSRWVPYVW